MKITAILISLLGFTTQAFAAMEGTHTGQGTFYSNGGQAGYSVEVSLDFSTAMYTVEYELDNGTWSCLFEYTLTIAPDDSFKVYKVKTAGVEHTSTEPLARGVIDRANESFAIVTNHPSACNDGNVSHWSIHSNMVNGKLVRVGMNLEDTSTYRLRDDEL
jgi:hypothetical protein